MARFFPLLPAAAVLIFGFPPLPPAAAAAEFPKIKLANGSSPPILDSIPPYGGVETGIFKTHGLDVWMAEVRGDSVLTTAMIAGDVQVGSSIGATSAMVRAAKGARLRLWVVPQPVTPYHLIARKDAAASIKALAGKTLAVSGVGAVSYHMPRIIMERDGVDPEKAKYVVAGSNADRFKALLSGKVDATVVSNLEAAKLGSYPELVHLVTVASVVPEIPFTFGMAREDFIQKEPETMYRLARGMIEANRWIAANKAGTVAVAAKVIPDESPQGIGRAHHHGQPRPLGP